MSELSPDELRQLRSFFLDEASEHLEAIDQALSALEAMPEDGAALSALLRKLHTLKGSAGSVDLDDLSHDAHVVEDQVVALREAARAPNSSELEALISGIDVIRKRVAQIARAVHGTPSDARMALRFSAPRDAPSKRGNTRLSDGMQIRVEVEHVDELMEAVGELVIDRTRIARRLLELEGCVRDLAKVRLALRAAIKETGLAASGGAIGDVSSELTETLRHLERAATGMNEDTEHLRRTSQVLKEGLEQVRLMEVGRMFQRLAAPLKEMARRSGKAVELVTSGEHTAIDKAVVERVADPLLHLLRNCVAHGIEPEPVRIAMGKPPTGKVELSARQRGDQIIVEVADDGAGVDLAGVRAALVRARRLSAEEAARLPDVDVVAAILEAGVSTRDAADDLAGRGVGLDAVKEAIERLGGVISCTSSPGKGTRFVVRLPLTTAIERALLFKVGGNVYAVPASSVIETGPVAADEVKSTPEGDRIMLRGRPLPLLRLGALLGEPPPPGPSTRRASILLDHEGTLFGMTCDKLIGPREIVIKGLGPLLGQLPLFAGATISGAGKVQLILDVATLAGLAGSTISLGARPSGAVGGPRVLLADDSRSLRETAALILAQGGFRVETVADGWEAWELLQDRRFDLLLTDGEMPRLDGYELTGKVRRHPALRAMPVIVMTSRSADASRDRALSAGADQFLPKPLRRQPLLDTVSLALRKRS
jgi:chemosensory pili system protein ChpA (sensor histidine kinase/response regulator)